MSSRRRFICCVVAATAFTLSASILVASAESDRPKGSVDAEAMKSLERMNDYLARAKQFSVTADIGYDVVQEWGEKIEFGETRVLTVRRPNDLRVDTTDRDGTKSGVVFDGKDISVFDLQGKVYATAAKPGSLDNAISYFVDDLGMRLPMAPILRGRLPQMVKEWAHDVRYVGQESIAGVPCDHVAMQGEWEDVQMWIARGDQPLLQRMVVTYTRAEGKPQFWGQFEKWNLTADIPDSLFVFQPAEGAAPIPFKPRRSAAQPAAVERKGGQP